MFCPKCSEKFRWHVMVCPTCDVDTVDRLEGPEPTPDAELTCVFVTGDAGLIPVAKSLLEEETIEYLVRGESVQNFLGAGRIGGFNYAAGPVEFWVRADQAERARGLLTELSPATSEGPGPNVVADDREDDDVEGRSEGAAARELEADDESEGSGEVVMDYR